MSTAEAKVLEARAAQYRDYDGSLKATIIQAIAANDGNIQGTAKLFSIPYDTVYYWWRNSERYREVQSTKPRQLSDKLENIAHDLADSIESHDLSIVSLNHKATAMGIVIDKMQLLKGLPTSISVDLERTELTVILQGSLSAGLGDVIDVTPKAVHVTESKEVK